VSVERAKNGTLFHLGYMMELEGNHKPAIIAEMLRLAYN
jgi:hypothetical protein